MMQKLITPPLTPIPFKEIYTEGKKSVKSLSKEERKKYYATVQRWMRHYGHT